MGALMLWICIALALASIEACGRTASEDAFRSSAPAVAPAEPVEATSTPTATPDAIDIPAGRCVLAMPSVAPPPAASAPALGCPVDPEPDLPALSQQRLSFREAPSVSIRVEMVQSEHDSMRGLMYRRSLGEDSGMLFDLGSP